MEKEKFIYEAIIEIPKNSTVKYEYDKERNCVLVDRFLYGTNHYPGDYGFIENTLELDADPIDVLVWVSQPTTPGGRMKIRIIGALGMIDNGEVDTKLIAVFVGDPIYNKITSYKNLPEKAADQITDFFTNYKNLEKKVTEIKNWHNAEAAVEMIENAKKRYLKHKTLILNKDSDKLKSLLKVEQNN